MGMCLSNQIKAESPFHTGVISSKNVSGNGTELSNPSSKDSSASILPTTWSEGVISSKNVSGNWTELSNPSSKASSASVPHNSQSEGANSSKNVSGNGTELSNPSSKASSASIPQIPWSEGEILQSPDLTSFTFSDHITRASISLPTSSSHFFNAYFLSSYKYG